MGHLLTILGTDRTGVSQPLTDTYVGVKWLRYRLFSHPVLFDLLQMAACNKLTSWFYKSWLRTPCSEQRAELERWKKKEMFVFFPLNRTEQHAAASYQISSSNSLTVRGEKKSTIFSAERVSVGHIVKRFKSKWKLWSRIQIQKHSHLVEDSMNTPADDDKDRPTITTITNYFYNRLISLGYFWQ